MTLKKIALLLLLLSALLLLSTTSLSDDVDCVYTAYIRTGSIFKGGTDSVIGLELYDKYGYYIKIPDIVSWGGLMGPTHNYFERGNLDIFSGRATCLPGTQVCAVNVTSDGSGPHHGWYCNYVEVNVAGVHAQCAQDRFDIEQWLALDASPYELHAFRNHCRGYLSTPRQVVSSSTTSA